MIVNVYFKDKWSGLYFGRKYSYRCKFPVKVGDLVIVETKRGQETVQVCEVNVPESSVAPNILPLLKSVVSVAEVPGDGK